MEPECEYPTSLTKPYPHAPLSYSQCYVNIAENRNSQSCTERVCDEDVTSLLPREGPGVTQK